MDILRTDGPSRYKCRRPRPSCGRKLNRSILNSLHWPSDGGAKRASRLRWTRRSCTRPINPSSRWENPEDGLVLFTDALEGQAKPMKTSRDRLTSSALRNASSPLRPGMKADSKIGTWKAWEEYFGNYMIELLRSPWKPIACSPASL